MKASGNPGCAWCGNPIFAAGCAGLVKARGYGEAGTWQARFHRQCAAAILEICERRSFLFELDDMVALDAAVIEEPAPVRPRRRRQRAEPLPLDHVTLPIAAVADEIEAEAMPRLAPPRIAQILDLAERGIPANQIAARLRAPYATVRAILEAA